MKIRRILTNITPSLAWALLLTAIAVWITVDIIDLLLKIQDGIIP